MVASTTPPNAETPHPPRLAVATSGGRDSTALLHCAARLARERGLEVHALHVHHGLNPAADDWQGHLVRQCARWARAGLPVRLHVQRLDRTPPRGASVEAWARRERYAALAALAQGAGCRVVLLAHHRRDQAETVLLQALRGAGARGLAAMPALREQGGLVWARPWLMQPRSHIEAYVRRHRLAFVDDDSNLDPRFDRNRLRARVWPTLERAFPDVEGALIKVAMRSQEAAACLEALAQVDAGEGGVSDAALEVQPWLLLPLPRRTNLLRHQLERWCGRGAPETLVQRLLGELSGVSSAQWPAPGGRLQLYRGRLQFVADPLRAGVAAATDATVLDLSRPGRYRLPGEQGSLTVIRTTEGGIDPKRLRQAQLRGRLGGERFQLAPGTVPRSLKKQYQALAVPAWARCGPLVYAADGSLLFVPGLGVEARAAAPSGSPQLRLAWTPASLD